MNTLGSVGASWTHSGLCEPHEDTEAWLGLVFLLFPRVLKFPSMASHDQQAGEKVKIEI